MARFFIYFAGVVVALGILCLFGLTPPVLIQKAQDFANGTIAAAQNTRRLSNERQERVNDATAVLDSMPKSHH